MDRRLKFTGNAHGTKEATQDGMEWKARDMQPHGGNKPNLYRDGR